MQFRSLLTLLAAPLLVAACSSTSDETTAPELDVPAGAEAVSLLGQPLYAPPIPAQDLPLLESALENAQAACASDPGNPINYVWLGRRTAALGHFRDAVRIFGEGIGRWPGNPRFWRHRGHRMITLRQFALAQSDLEQAAALAANILDEPEDPVLPNSRGIVLETLKQNIQYHLGIAKYLQGDFGSATENFFNCLNMSKNADSVCASTYWLYMTLRRDHQDDAAAKLLDAITPNMDIVQYTAYFELCLMFKGQRNPDRLAASRAGADMASADFATVSYGIGNWYLCNGDADKAREYFQRASQSPMWPAFGCIAAEVEMTRGTISR
jgi:tetratricopeptide (TPR) repeat protein